MFTGGSISLPARGLGERNWENAALRPDFGLLEGI
jgi:hypothetical protein